MRLGKRVADEHCSDGEGRRKRFFEQEFMIEQDLSCYLMVVQMTEEVHDP